MRRNPARHGRQQAYRQQRHKAITRIMYGVIAPTPEDPEPDTSDIPEADEEWFKRTRLVVPCREIVQSDETYCPACGLRWDTGEEKPPCLKLVRT